MLPVSEWWIYLNIFCQYGKGLHGDQFEGLWVCPMCACWIKIGAIDTVIISYGYLAGGGVGKRMHQSFRPHPLHFRFIETEKSYNTLGNSFYIGHVIVLLILGGTSLYHFIFSIFRGQCLT